jgi:hypothetical protein
VGLAGLALATIPLAAPGARLVPAALGGGPGWLEGIYGGGFGVAPGTYYAMLWLSFASYLCVLLAAPALGRRLLLGACLLLLTAFALAPPLLSQDVFSYIDYARLGVLHGLNPYSHAPVDVASDPAFPFVGWADSSSAYAPLFTAGTYPLAWVSVPVALWLLKGAAAASVAGLAVLVARLAPARGLNSNRALAMVALNPLVLVHVVGGAHNDGIAMLLAMGGCAAVLARREALGGFALLAATAVKISSAFVIPFALLGTLDPLMGRKPPYSVGNRPVNMGRYGGMWRPGRTRRPGGDGRLGRASRLLVGMALALLAIGAMALPFFGTHALDSLALAGENQARVSNYSLPNLLSEFLGADVDTVRAGALGAYCLLLLGLLAWVWRGADWIRAAGWAGLGLLLASAWLLPWYLIWVLPLAALSRDARLVVVVLALTALQLAARIPL